MTENLIAEGKLYNYGLPGELQVAQTSFWRPEATSVFGNPRGCSLGLSVCVGVIRSETIEGG